MPGSTAAKVKSPWSLLVTVISAVVAVLIKVALAPTMAELLVSFTDPLIDPVIVWEKVGVSATISSSAKKNKLMTDLAGMRDSLCPLESNNITIAGMNAM